MDNNNKSNQQQTGSEDNTLADKLSGWWYSLNNPMQVIAVVVLVLGLLILALALAVSFQSKEPAQPPTTNVTAPATADVTIDKNGLSPATIVISAGTQLTWTNNDEKPHQIAADPHPLHNSIDGFDSDKVLQKGDSLSFIFEMPGTYTVHDHLDPLNKKFQATVTVE